MTSFIRNLDADRIAWQGCFWRETERERERMVYLSLLDEESDMGILIFGEDTVTYTLIKTYGYLISSIVVFP